MGWLRAATCVALLALGGAAPAALAVQGNTTLVGPPHFKAVSDDGSNVLLETTESLTAQDTDSDADVYRIAGGTAALLSIGSTGGNAPLRPATFAGASADASRVLFTTREALVPADTDSAADLYAHSGGQLDLLTPADATFLSMTRDGQHVFFSTAAQLATEDMDGTTDIYEDAGGTVRLVSVGPAGANVVQSAFKGSSATGDRAWFETRTPLVAADDDASGVDVYERADGATRLLTDWPAAAGGSADHTLVDFSDDGQRVFLRSAGQVTPDDTDGAADIFAVSSAGTVLVSTGPADVPGGGAAQLIDATPDGTRAYFSSPEVLVPGRPAGAYEAGAGVTTWLGATVTSLKTSTDSTATYFVTADALAPEDTDAAEDVYLRFGGATSLVSGTSSADVPRVESVSNDGSRLFFTTTSPLDAADVDSSVDLYALSGGDLYLLSAGPTSWPAAPPNLSMMGMTPNGGQVFFETFDRLTAADGDTELDLYEARFPDLAGYARPKSASPLQVSLVPAYQRCTAPNATHGPPLAYGSCVPPAREPGRLTVGTPDANGEAASNTGVVRLTTVLGNPATPEDEADVRILLQDTDVREAAGLSDYPGELELALDLLITGRDGAEAPTVPVTEEDAELSFSVPCAVSADMTVGSTCAIDTTADALVPGLVQEQRRTLWAAGAVRVFDGGPDGDADTLADDDLFQFQGIFVP
jgi:hypothetical protein